MVRIALKVFPAALLTAVAVLAAACSSEEVPTVPPPTATEPPPTEAPLTEVPETPKLLSEEAFIVSRGPVSPDGIWAIFATPDLGVGLNRVGFILASAKAAIKVPGSRVSSYYVGEAGAEGEGELVETATAAFHPWPYGTRGLYATHLTFDRVGEWRLEMSIPSPDGGFLTAELRFPVHTEPEAVGVGQNSPSSVSKTVNDVQGLHQLTTGSLKDPDLYQVAISEALDNDLPTVVVMASPAFCTNAVCGPQVETLQELKDMRKGEANFIHVDIYDNPDEIQGDLSRARLSPTAVEWNLPSPEWTFVIDPQGVVTHRFEGYATIEELLTALDSLG